jgi:hypothetical protein
MVSLRIPSPWGLAAAASAVLFLSFAGQAAAASTCGVDNEPDVLHDGLTFQWGTNNGAAIGRGTDDPFANTGRLDEQEGGGGFTSYNANADGPCSLELSGRQIVFPAQTLNSLSIVRKVYVPSGGLAFARQLDEVTNPTAAPVAFDLRWETSTNYGNAHRLVSTSSGDASMTTADHWAAEDDSLTDPAQASTGQPAVVHVWDADAPGAARAIDTVVKSISDLSAQNGVVQYTGLTIAPGQTLTFMRLIAQRWSSDEAVAAATLLSAGPAEVYAGLTAAELATLQNFPADGDGDRDGRPNSADNCPSAANPDQADLDRDGIGDACDDDIDGDGVSNATEIARGSDPAKADSDGDGVPDGADGCPTIAGLVNGCPRFDGPRDTRAPKLRLRAAKTVKHKTLRKRGARFTASCDEACSITATLSGAITGKATLAKAGSLVLAESHRGSRTGARTLRLKPSAKLARALGRRAALTITVVATDAAGNRTTKTTKIGVR